MGQLTSREMILTVLIIVFGTIFFGIVCAWIYFLFKRLEKQDRAETEHFSETPEDDENKP